MKRTFGRYLFLRVLHCLRGQVVREKFETHKEGMEILSLDEDELRRAIPQGSAVQESNVVAQLRKLMEDVSVKHKNDAMKKTVFQVF